MTTQTESTGEERAAPAHVIAALCRVADEIGGIEKLTTDQRRQRGMAVPTGEGGVTFAYRSIDQVTQAAQPLFARYGVIIVPTLISLDVRDVTINNKPWTDTEVVYHWDIYGPGGATDKIEASTAGLGRDNSDKGYGKAMTNAYKNLVLRLLTIGDPSDDPDQVKHETDEVPTWTADHQRRYEDLVARVKALTELPDGKEHLDVLLGKAGEAGFEKFTAWAGHEDRLDAATEAVVEVEERAAAIKAQDAEQETPQDKPKRQRAKPGSAVEDATAKVEDAFPGTEDVSDASQGG